MEFTHHFRPYLLGREFTLRTDHGSLVWLKNFKEPEGQLARWLEKLQEYDFIVMHRQGSRHGNADALSRIPCKQCGRGDRCGNEDDQVVEIGAITGPFLQQLNNLGEVQRLQAEDDDIAPVLNAVKEVNVPPGDTIPSLGAEKVAFTYNSGRC